MKKLSNKKFAKAILDLMAKYGIGGNTMMLSDNYVQYKHHINKKVIQEYKIFVFLNTDKIDPEIKSFEGVDQQILLLYVEIFLSSKYKTI